jgi:hypothetical protein
MKALFNFRGLSRLDLSVVLRRICAHRRYAKKFARCRKCQHKLALLRNRFLSPKTTCFLSLDSISSRNIIWSQRACRYCKEPNPVARKTGALIRGALAFFATIACLLLAYPSTEVWISHLLSQAPILRRHFEVLVFAMYIGLLIFYVSCAAILERLFFNTSMARSRIQKGKRLPIHLSAHWGSRRGLGIGTFVLLSIFVVIPIQQLIGYLVFTRHVAVPLANEYPVAHVDQTPTAIEPWLSASNRYPSSIQEIKILDKMEIPRSMANEPQVVILKPLESRREIKFTVFHELGETRLSSQFDSTEVSNRLSLSGLPTHLRVRSHADCTGSPELNMELSKKRSFYVAKDLVGRRFFLDQKHMLLEGIGANDPAVPDAVPCTPEVRNRRSEITLDF